MGKSNVNLAAACVALLALTASCGNVDPDIRELFANQSSGVIRLPDGVFEIHEEIRTLPGARDLVIAGSDTVLKAAPDFKGRAILVVENGTNITLRDFRINGSRSVLAKPFEAAPPENAFRIWYRENGILADQVDGLEITRVNVNNVVHFPILVSRSKGVRIISNNISKSGNYNAKGKTNLSGGILLEEGTSDFEINQNVVREVAGNGIWTHSLFTSSRLSHGMISENRLEDTGLDGIQVGHATGVTVERNRGLHIGYPAERVDVENGRIPAAIDTAGNVDASRYVFNRFDEINGKCMDLDGFHDGVVSGNTCVNSSKASNYPNGHYGIVMNNSHPDAHSNKIELRGNTVDGAMFGGLYVMGSGHRIEGNRFLNLNLAGCNENKEINCIYNAAEPDLLQSGIYLGRGIARKEETRGNEIRSNRISGFKMDEHCLTIGPGVEKAANVVAGNQCEGAAKSALAPGSVAPKNP